MNIQPGFGHSNTANSDLTMATIDRPAHVPKRPVIKKMHVSDDIITSGVDGQGPKMQDLYNADPFDQRNIQKN